MPAVAIGPSAPPFVIAEMSGNHNQSLERALAIVDAAADGRARTRSRSRPTPPTRSRSTSSDGEFLIDDPELSVGRALAVTRSTTRPTRRGSGTRPIFERARAHGA